MRYSDCVAEWLKEEGYTHCFFVAGGNIMHLLASLERRLTCISVVHEVAAGIAAEYFNEVSRAGKALALVTAGPGLTNIVTALAGAYLESRELLVIGGQVKTTDLAGGILRQRGIQEVAGTRIAEPIAKQSVLVDRVFTKAEMVAVIRDGAMPRKGPVFLEMPLDIQGRVVGGGIVNGAEPTRSVELGAAKCDDIAEIVRQLSLAKRPVLLLGGGVSREVAREMELYWEAMGVPVMTTWNGADRIPSDHPLYFGRPNTWGQRYSNILIQQADCLLAVGTRLGLQQTGFNHEAFVPGGVIMQVDCDESELHKGHPRLGVAVKADADDVLRRLRAHRLGDYGEWSKFCRGVKAKLPIIELCNVTRDGYVSPYVFVNRLSGLSSPDDVIVPCSSGGAFTVAMQAIEQKRGQRIVTNKGLASMGYGLSGAIGAAFANMDGRILLIEGDGGFAQNIQELGTVARHDLNVKMFIFDNGGYASIRMTQENYFGGRYIGCDRGSGLGLPNWPRLFDAFEIRSRRVGVGFEGDKEFRAMLEDEGPAAFIVNIDPEQTYFPKISSRVTETGGMISNALDDMTPPLGDALNEEVRVHKGC